MLKKKFKSNIKNKNISKYNSEIIINLKKEKKVKFKNYISKSIKIKNLEFSQDNVK